MLSFEDLSEGTDSTRTVTVTNSGPGLLVIFTDTIVGMNSPFSAVDGRDTLMTGESLNLDVTYSDDDFVGDTDTFRIVTNVGDFDVALEGNYLAAPNFLVTVDDMGLNSGDVLTFTDVPENTDSTRTLVLSNSGSADLMIDSVSMADSTLFTVGTVPAVIAVGATADVAVTYSPSEVATATDVLTFSTNSGDFVVNLNGVSIVNSVIDYGIPATAAYPNPTSDDFRLELVAPLRDGNWTLTSAAGQVVRRGVWPAGKQAHNFDLSELVAGTYTIEVVSGANRLLARVVKL